MVDTVGMVGTAVLVEEVPLTATLRCQMRLAHGVLTRKRRNIGIDHPEER